MDAHELLPLLDKYIGAVPRVVAEQFARRTMALSLGCCALTSRKPQYFRKFDKFSVKCRRM